MSQEQDPLSTRASYYGGLGPAIVGVCWPLFAIATVVVALRIYTYATIVKTRGGMALIWACVAWVRSFSIPNVGGFDSAYGLALPSVIIYTLAARDGLGNHMTVVAKDPDLPEALLFEWIAAVTISFSVGFAKLGAMFYTLDLQRRTYQAGRWALFIAIAVTVSAEDNRISGDWDR